MLDTMCVGDCSQERRTTLDSSTEIPLDLRVNHLERTPVMAQPSMPTLLRMDDQLHLIGRGRVMLAHQSAGKSHDALRAAHELHQVLDNAELPRGDKELPELTILIGALSDMLGD